MSKNSPNPILGALGQVLETAINGILRLDPFAVDPMHALEGRSLDLRWREGNLAARLTVQSGRVKVGPTDAQEADLSVTSSLAALASVALARLQGAGMPAGKVQMSGDLGMARALSDLLDRFEPDFDLPFTDTFGNVFGMQVSGVVKAALRQARQSGKQVVEDLADYVRDESRDGIAKAEFEVFATEVETIRNRGERLAQRIRQLQRKASQGGITQVGAEQNNSSTTS